MKSLQTSVQWLSHAVSQWDNRVPSAGQACPKSGQRCPEAGQTCPKKSQPIEIIRLISLIDTVKNFTRRKPPISHFFYVKTAPCANRRLVRMVCALPPRPKAKHSTSAPPFAAPTISPVPFLPSAARAGDLVSELGSLHKSDIIVRARANEQRTYAALRRSFFRSGLRRSGLSGGFMFHR